MATAGSVLSEEQLLCPICLDLFNQPVSTPCGHNFCRDCIQSYWQCANLSQCPVCKQKFYRRPELKVNTFISEVASHFKKSVEKREENETSTEGQSSGHKGDVSCDVCIGKRVKALKSCLDCLASFCETHLEPHHVLGTFKKHHLVNPMMNMQDRMCQKHEKLLDRFCNTDQAYVCQIRVKKDHKAHHTVPIEGESRNKRAQIGRIHAEVEKMIHDRLQKIGEIKQTTQLSRGNTEKEIEESLQVFTKLLQSIHRGKAEVVEGIGAKQRQVESRANGLIVELEQEVDELKRKSTELEQLSHTEDDFYLLQSFPAFSTLPATKDWSDVSVESVVYVGAVRRAVRRVACQLEETVKAEVKRLCETEFQRARQCAVDVTLDPDTAHPKLVLSENKKQVYHGNVALSLPDNSERRSLSPVLSAVVWTLLSCGILLAFCFLLFTLRFKNNRIVKMSSPNLNVLTLFGSVLTYISGFLFAFDERTHPQGGASTAVLQARMWTLCVGSTLVFGPILGKTWRLYRVFTQRVPDKRVIIRDIQLMGMVFLLIAVDLLVLTAWNLTDPIRCSRSVSAVIKVVEKDVSYSLSQLDSCSSVYSDLWVIIIAVQKGCLLLYGTYLAGLTSNVSHPPVNQSPTIITAVTLVTLSSSVAVPVSIFLQAWPNLVYSTVAGAIFICTLATNCMLFVPQLTQWRQFEEDQNNPSQMAKYFSSPSKSQPSVYSQDEIYYLLGENNSMKKLINEKNAVIDSLQEQVNNAKDKLLRLMSASQPPGEQEMDSSATNLNSSSTQTTELQSDSPSSPLPHIGTKSRLSPPHLSPRLTAAAVPSSSNALPPSAPAPNSTTLAAPSSPLPDAGENQRTASVAGPIGRDTAESRRVEDFKQPASLQSPGLLRTAEETVDFVTSLQSLSNYSGLTSPLGPNARLTGFVSSEQLQEILQELSVDAVIETALKSPSQTARTPSQLKFIEASALSPLSPRTPRSPRPPVVFSYPSISPYAMRKRRPPFHSSRRGLAPPCFYTGSEAAVCGKTRENCEAQNQDKHPEGVTVDSTLRQVHNSDLEVEEGEEDEETEGHEVIRKCRRCVSRSHRCSVSPCADHGHTPDVEASDDNKQHHRRIRDSCGYWDSDSSSSTDYCYYHRPYCDSCLQRGSLLSSDTSSDSSDSEYEGYSLYRSPHPVVFKEDIKPTFV
ncbi:probable G-protein coupled receptor 156 isoform X2 [Thunnus maccoyii]|uniref:probable G-protein coupled receptor 156 isoform X2 n=1 Tax=Thunnus maccoyii TaxID=8240 RepID=UPI001C4D6F90|nr:probable G-protein coupled receptor 156 isoform X2 [Thunnus maccoyii]